jgi:hypothetical protein
MCLLKRAVIIISFIIIVTYSDWLIDWLIDWLLQEVVGHVIVSSLHVFGFINCLIIDLVLKFQNIYEKAFLQLLKSRKVVLIVKYQILATSLID